jgi:hypothetical protein
LRVRAVIPGRFTRTCTMCNSVKLKESEKGPPLASRRVALRTQAAAQLNSKYCWLRAPAKTLPSSRSRLATYKTHLLGPALNPRGDPGDVDRRARLFDLHKTAGLSSCLQRGRVPVQVPSNSAASTSVNVAASTPDPGSVCIHRGAGSGFRSRAGQLTSKVIDCAVTVVGTFSRNRLPSGDTSYGQPDSLVFIRTCRSVLGTPT